MSDEGQLIPLEEFGVPAIKDDKQIDALTRTTDYLPQVRVYGSESSIVKEGKFPMGHLGLYFSAENIVDMGDQFDCAVCFYRPRASLVVGDQPISFYGNFTDNAWVCDSNEFQTFFAKAKAKEQGYLAGLEYLLWLPEVERFGLFFMGNPTLRRESALMKAMLGKAATVKIKLIKTKKFVWHGVSVLKCTTPFDLPDKDALLEEVDKFKNPANSQVELADDSDSARAR